MSELKLKKALKEKKLVFGAQRTLKLIKNGKVGEVFIAKNCPERTKKTLEHYCNLSGIKLNKINKDNEEVGVICKKPFSISSINA